MLNAALTGNVASGKSTVVAWFAEWGATIIDSDAIVADAQRPGSKALAELSSHFGAEIILSDGSLDRARLRQVLVADNTSRATINAIMHPIVQARRKELLAEAKHRSDPIVVSDIPLLFEVLDPDDFDCVILVDSKDSLRRDRLIARGLTAQEAERLMATQLPAGEKRARADFIIDNNGSLEDLKASSRNVWNELRARADS